MITRLKSIVTYLVLFASFTQAFIQPLIYIEYQIRKEYIIAELCKERFQEINTCDGRCYLVTKLNDSQQQESEEKERSIRPLELNLFLARWEIPSEQLRYQSIDHSIERPDQVYEFEFVDYMLDPPRV